jgi:uncharacterized protein (TIGR02246 family)
MRKWSLLGLGSGVVAVLAIGLVVGVGTTPAHQDKPKTTSGKAPGKGKLARAFIAAFNTGDARAVAGFWTPKGDYVDQVGRHFRGRPAIQKLFEKVFAEQKGAKLSVTVTAARLVTDDVALEDGFTEVTPIDGGPPSVAQFSAVLVRKDGKWFFESVRDAVAHPPTNAEHFDDLEWLLGDWAGEAKKGESATASYQWADNRNFIVSTFATTLNGIPVAGGTQWIAWDAIDKQVRSWSFYSNGGFGEAAWMKDGNRWTIKTTARTADGKKLTAVNILTKVDADNATWQVTKLTVDGKPAPDAPVVKLKRVKPEKP